MYAEVDISITIRLNDIKAEDIQTVLSRTMSELGIKDYKATNTRVYEDDGTRLQQGIDYDNKCKETWYKPTCPRGYRDCISDPAYTRANHSAWYKEMYGDLEPEEVIKLEGNCLQRFKEDPDEEYYCYDDEDK